MRVPKRYRALVRRVPCLGTKRTNLRYTSYQALVFLVPAVGIGCTKGWYCRY
ncbi:hypothetical protein [Bacteroides clarus]|uniref:hypothetical protein n=1 Tax=Bacteroides clarus TaxID=626929 RepID=UPI0018A9FE93|nr:hypothetical protein [Bacteroides clarus]MCQ1544511.1 hypothetical protein [Bacteroides clarus]